MKRQQLQNTLQHIESSYPALVFLANPIGFSLDFSPNLCSVSDDDQEYMLDRSALSSSLETVIELNNEYDTNR